MTLGTSVDAPSPYGWDWTATTHGGREPKAMARDLLGSLAPATVLPGKGRQGWTRSLEAFDADGYKVGTVFLGGRDDVHFEASSSAADTARDHVVTVDQGRTARVDTRVDTRVRFEALEHMLEVAARRYGSEILAMEGRTPDGRSKGRTVYLGAPSSRIRIRLYEKWLESPGQYVEGTNRIEVQVRPVGSAVKARVSTWSRAQTFGASKVARDLAAELGADLAPKTTLHIARPTPDLERTLEVMGQQYRRSVDRWLTTSGGDLGTVLDHLLGRQTGA